MVTLLYSFARRLHEGTRTLKHCASSLSVGMTGPANMYLSPVRVGVRSSTHAKVNYAAVAMEYIIDGRVAALEMVDGTNVYYEFETTDGSIHCAVCDGNTVHWDDMDSSHGQSSHAILPHLLYALRAESTMDETKKMFEKCVDAYNTTGSIPEALYYELCDDFYFEWKSRESDDCKVDGELNADIIKQAIRTGAYVPHKLLADCGITREIKIETVKAEPETETNIADNDKMEACKRGDYCLPHVWDIERQDHIPSVKSLEGFVPSESFYTLVDLLDVELKQVIERMDEGEFGVNAIKNNFVNAILVGKPGTGKTTLANALGATFGMPVRTVTVSRNTEEDLYQGMTKVAEGGFKFVETPFLDVYKNGGIILLEEFNLSDPAVMMGALGQAIVSPFIIYEDGYKEVRRHPLCVIISTMNTATQGSREPSEAFTSRSADVFMLNDPTEDSFIRILELNSGNKKMDCKKVYNAYAKIQAYLTSSAVNAEDVAMSVTLRHCLAALRQMRIGRPFKDALKNTLIGTIAIKDIALATQVYDTVIEPMR